MMGKSSLREVLVLLPRPQLLLVGSLVVILLSAMLGGTFIFNRQLAVQQQTSQMRAEYEALYEIAILQRTHLQLAEALRAREPQVIMTNYQLLRGQIDHHLQAIEHIYNKLNFHPGVRQQLDIYQQEWTELQAILNQVEKQPTDEATLSALRNKLPVFEVALTELLEESHFALDQHIATWLSSLQSVAELLSGANLIFGVIVFLTGYTFFQFIRERKRAEEAIEASERRHRVLLETIPDVVLRRKRDGIYTDYKPAKSFGRFMPSSDFIGTHISQILPPDVVELSMAASEKALLTGEEQVYEYRMPNRLTGIIRDYEARVLPSGDDEVQVIVRDVTEDKLQEERLHQSQKLESLGVLAGGIAHDFNNLLTGMLGQTSLAKFKLARGLPVTEHIDKAITSAERAADLTRQLLAYAGKGKFQIMALNLSELIRETTGLLETALPNRAELQLQLDDALPMIEADRSQIQQVVMNLVINAAEALHEEGGHVRITTRHQTLSANDDTSSYMGDELLPAAYVTLEIFDNGCGMDGKVISRIFDPFFSTKTHGHGLGLAATLGIMRTHHGGIQVQSQPGSATTFTLLFPALRAQVVKPSAAEADVESYSTAKPLVLVIDDESAIRESVTDILAMEGIQVVTAASGNEGIACFRQQQHQIGLVLLDLKMPGMSGEETLRALRQIDAQVSVILSSGYNETEVSHLFHEGEIMAFLQKPYNFALLCQQVRKALNNHLTPAH